ncbi:MAG: PhnD/SsuA/transferrin family substrate-binding protein [Gammaproteobacteria bacterium]|nr:PhnD/SsuA/transferrin family substrate-binding protein [Gammaproteobacteria bacterium]MDH5800174.1 PhnD/SsuA/transferrin family substrate-binding protein [Gammaproteobacteria bacterium]
MKNLPSLSILLFFLCSTIAGTVVAKTQPATLAVKSVTLAVLMPAPAKKIHSQWKPLADYLSKKLNMKVDIVTPRGLEQAKKTLAEVDFVFANSYLYDLLKEGAKIIPVVQMENTSNSIYSQGRFLVRSDSPIKSVSELKGKKIALISPFGAGAYLAPKAYLMKHGIDIDKEVNINFTKDLKKAAYMVMLGEADAAVMCDVSYGILSKKVDTGELTFFDKTDAFPEGLIFTTHESDNAMVKTVREALLNADEDTMKPLRNMKIGKFVPYNEQVETRLKHLKKEANL